MLKASHQKYKFSGVLFYTITSIILCFTIGRFELMNTSVIHFVIERMTAVDHKVKRTMTNNEYV